MDHLVSIVMPVYNGEAFVAEAIRSVIAQAYLNWELIVVDDGSTDGTPGIVATFDDPRIRYTYQDNHGQAAALNRGLELAQGDYVTTLDADDWLVPNSLLDRVIYLDQHTQFGAVYGDGYYCKSSGEPLVRFSERCRCGVVGDIYEVLVVSNIFGTGAAVMIRRNVLEQHQLRYDESIIWCQDWDFYMRVAEQTTFGYVDSITVCYRLHVSNMTLVLPSERRRDSAKRASLKALASPRFASISTSRKTMFFYQLLHTVMEGQVEEQATVFDNEQFRALPGRQQARLLRLTALDYLLKRNHPGIARQWLHNAWALAPSDLKTGLVAVLSTLNIDLARLVARLWRSSRPSVEVISPFEMAQQG